MKQMEDYSALRLLPERFRGYIRDYERGGAATEELRLRAGRRPSVVNAGRVSLLADAPPVSREDIGLVLETATRHSLHAAAEELRRGYLSAAGGVRIGVCGSAVMKDSEVTTLRDISSLNIRVARELHGIADGVFDEVYKGGRPRSTLIISPPGLGKTTLLRELVRLISNRGLLCGVADERGELAAAFGGCPGFDIGENTDVITGMPKREAVAVLLRTMSPRLIALDEISEPHDAAAAALVANCGAALMATVHGADIEDVLTRPALSELIGRRVFDAALIISLAGGRRQLRLERFPQC